MKEKYESCDFAEKFSYTAILKKTWMPLYVPPEIYHLFQSVMWKSICIINPDFRIPQELIHYYIANICLNYSLMLVKSKLESNLSTRVSLTRGTSICPEIERL